MQRRVIAATLAVLALVTVANARAQAREEARIIVATQVLEESRAARDEFIPDRLLERAYGIAIIPEAKKAAFGVGVRDGRGVLVVRDRQGRFTSPVFLRLTGGSIGWQIGAQETDIILVFTTRASIEGITGGKITLGGDASVAAGPVGRQATAATDVTFSAEVYSYSRSRGLFAGLALDGSVLRIDNKANSAFYRKRVLASDVLSGNVTSNSESVQRLLRAVAASTHTTSAAGSPTDAPATTRAAPAAPAPAPAAGTKTFPMEDPKPGEEPPK
jgi:lipid-binding SYLF domain-containing protein